jgi:hypothetical protein
MAVGRMVITPSSMSIDSGTHVFQGYCLNIFKSFSIGITDESNSWSTLSGYLGWYDIHAKFHDFRFSNSSNVRVITSTI